MKLEWGRNNPNSMDSLFHLEDHSLLYGCTAIIGLEHTRNFDKFRMLFDNVTDKKLIHQALLIYDDYSQTSYANTHYMGNGNLSTWRDLFHPTNQRNGFEHTSNALNLLLDNLNDFSDVSLKQLIDNYIAQPRKKFDWRYYFIKYSETLHGNWGILYLNDPPYDWYTLRQATFRGFNWQSIARAIWQSAPDKFTIGNWAYQYDPLYIANTQKKIMVNNKSIEIYENDSIIQIIDIPQDENDGIDIVDRVEFLIKKIC